MIVQNVLQADNIGDLVAVADQGVVLKIDNAGERVRVDDRLDGRRAGDNTLDFKRDKEFVAPPDARIQDGCSCRSR